MARHNLAVVLSRLNGTSFLGIDYVSPVKLTGGKKNPHLGRVNKVVTGALVQIYQNKFVSGYEAAVKRRLAASGKDPADFTSGPLPWGTRVPETPFIEHNGGHYIQTVFIRSGDKHYELDGVQVEPETINGMPVERPEGEQGGLEEKDKVIIRTINIANIRAVRFYGEHLEGEFYYEEIPVDPANSVSDNIDGDTAQQSNPVLDQIETARANINAELDKLVQLIKSN